MITEPVDLDIGSALAAGRKRSGRSLEEAAKLTRIRKVYLESLEANRFEDLPGRAYVVGFLKVYARYLDLDSEPLLAVYHSRNVIETNVHHSAKLRPMSGKAPGRQRSGRGIFLLGFMAVLLVGFGVYFLPAWLAPPAPILPLETAAQVKESLSSEPVGQNESAGTAPVTDPGIPMVGPVVLQVSPGAETPAAAPLMTPAGTPLPAVAKEGSTLRMLAIKSGKLIIEIDGRPAQSYTLREGLELTWPVKKEISVELDAPGQVHFWLDQVELVLGDRTTFLLRQPQEN